MSRGQYSPPNCNFPQNLPDYWKFEDGTIRRDLPELSDEELHALGWHGPIEMPKNHFEYSYEWNSETISFDATELDEFEKRRRVNYQMFWDLLLDTNAYSKIKLESSQSLAANTLATEFLALIGDAKRGEAKVEKIQESLIQINLTIPFTDEEFSEIERAFTKSGMFSTYTLTTPTI